MCGIIGVFNDKKASSIVINGLKKIKYRGEDYHGISSQEDSSYAKTITGLKKIKSKNIIGHNLHSVVGRVKQPIIKKGRIVINCEIYNWKKLIKKFKLKSKNDSELVIDLIEKIGIKKALEELDGVYAFAYWKNNKVYLARDILGVKPLFYTKNSFCSENKVINGEELNPRTIIEYDISTKKIKKIKRPFFKLGKKVKVNKTEELLIEAIKKRFPNKKFGILFSGGIDSTFLAYVAKKLKKDFICYTAALDEPGMKKADDLVHAKRIAKDLGFKLKIKKLKINQVENYLKKLVPLIEDNNVVKVGVGLTFFAALEQAKKDKVKVMFSGLGSEEIFAGYERHKKSNDINKECLSGLIKMYERDLYRDDVVSMYNGVELRLPFLDTELVKHSLNLPVKYKLYDNRNKIILRDIAKKIGLKEEYAERAKKAAQYGSKFDKAISKLAKKQGFNSKSEYLGQFYHPSNVKLGILWSGGKDSVYAAHIMKKQNYELSCLITLKSENDFSYMFHTPNIDIVKVQASKMNISVIMQKTKGEKEKELDDLKKAIKKAKKEYGIGGVVTGALYSNYQRERVEKICDELDLKIFSPLWHIDQEKEMRSLIKEGFKIIFSSVAAEGLDRSWLGREIKDKDVNKLVELNKKVGINIAGEGGEFESLVLMCPLFKERIKITDFEIYEEGLNANIIVKKAN